MSMSTDKAVTGAASYGGGKGGPLNTVSNQLGNTLQNQMNSYGQRSNTELGRTVAPLVGQVGGDFARNLIPDQQYNPPRLDLSGMLKPPMTPQQRVDQSRAGGGILKLRNPQPTPIPQPGLPYDFPGDIFDPMPEPMPILDPVDPGFGVNPISDPMPGGGYGGGKGIFQPGGPGGGFGGGKAMPIQDHSYKRIPEELYTPFSGDKNPY